MHVSEAEHEFRWLRYCAPEFAVNGNDIDVLDTPKSFHSRLISEAKRAKKRIVLAALYLGTGTLEKELVDAVIESSRVTHNKIQISILLDYVRGSRGKENSRTMLTPLLDQCEGSNNLRVSLYHTPNLRGLPKTFLPARFNEVIGISHLKVFIFDDTFIISGANLSNDYFVDRQDRYIAFKNCAELADFFHTLVDTVSEFSFSLRTAGEVKLHPKCAIHPYEGDFNQFKLSAHDSIRKLVQPSHETVTAEVEQATERGLFARIFDYVQHFSAYCSSLLLSSVGLKNSFSELEPKTPSFTKFQDNESTPLKNSPTPKKMEPGADTWVYPTVQMGLFGIRQDEVMTELLLKSFPKSSSVFFTTGYFNVTKNYCDAMIHSKADFNILLASPEANGFLGSSGVSKHIPAVYSHLCKKFFNEVKQKNRGESISLWEYIRTGWTFHGKGLWCYLSGQNLPSLTLIGSPNYGLRSVERDLEAQVVVFTKNEKLRRQLHREQQNLMNYSRKITRETFEQPRYHVPRWVAFVTYFIKRYF